MSRESLTSPWMLRWFPWALYSYVFGAAALGWGIGVGMFQPSLSTLIALLIGCALCVFGFVGMRPYMREARASVAELAKLKAKDEPQQ